MKNIKCFAVVSMFILGACTTTSNGGQKINDPQQAEANPAIIVGALTSTPHHVLGEKMPLVCADQSLGDSATQDRPNLQTMWENFIYDKPEGVWREVGGMVEVNGNLPYDQGQWTNACTVRLSYMLNRAGHKIPDNGHKTVSGKDYDQYFYRVSDMEDYLKDTFGAPDLAIEDGSANSFDMPNEPGIVLMDFPDSSFTGHITIWNGAGTVDGANIGGYRVLFWKLPCFTSKQHTVKADSAAP